METMQIGEEPQRLIVIDDFAADPDALRAAAAGGDFAIARHAYPGVRGELPHAYWPAQVDALQQAARLLDPACCTIELIDASFSIVTTPRAKLALNQRLPHCDSYDRDRVAFVHYLDPTGESGGTAFFRHRSTRFETIDRDRAVIYEAQLDAELRYGRPPAADYADDGGPLFERIAAVPARYNRAIVYRSFALHSGVIPPAATLSADPLAGRLTVTGFLTIA